MRKVKVLALLLAALMVVAVFAGCADTDAIVADVDSLEDRVTALEGLLNDQKDAIDDVKDQIGDVSDKLDDDTTADQLAATLEALKQLQEAMNAQNEQIKDLADKVTKVEEDAKESDENADEDAALVAAVKVYTAKLQELKIACELNKALYIEADYNAVVKALSDAIVAVAAAEKAADVEKAYNDAMAVYEAKAIVSTKLAAYYAQVANAITADSKALIDEIRAYIDLTASTATVVNTAPVYVKYGASAATLTNVPELMVANINGQKNADGTLVKVNVVAELQKAVAAYDYITGANNDKTFANNVKAAVEAIAAIKTVTYGEDLSAALAAFNAVKEDVLGNATATALNTNRYSNYVADSVLAQVTNAADLTAAQARQVELAVAAAMFDTYGTQSATGIASIFAAYNALADKTLYTNKAVYDAVDATLNKWIADYKLEAENVALIVNTKTGVPNFYYNYTLDKLTTELSVKAYTDFAAIANRIDALNKLTTVNAANVTEYGEITKAITAWQTLQKANTAADPQTIYTVKITLSAANEAAILAAYELTGAIDKDTNNFALYNFVNADVKAFFQNNYSTIAAQAKVINDAIKSLKTNIDSGSTKYPTIQKYIELKGEYAYDATSQTWKKVVTPSDVATIAGFLETYKAYDLASLLNTADFDAALAKAIARIEGFKAGAANIATLVEKVDYVALKKTDDVTYTAATKADIKARDFYYYVNLSDAAAVEAANAAYAAWIKAGATITLAEWVPAVDEKGEVIKDTFVFAPIADVKSLDALTQMNNDVAELKAAAAKLVAHFELVAQVWNANKAYALNASAEVNTKDVKVLTLVPAVLDAGVVNKVSYAYPVTLSTAAANTFSFNGVAYNLAAKGAMTETTALTATTNLQALIEAGYNAYQAFLAMNAEITVKTSNGDYVFDNAKRVDDASVKAAIDGIAGAEVEMLKDYAKDVVMSSSMDATQATIFCGYIDGVNAVSGNGSQLFNIAQELAARHNVKIANLARGTQIKVCNKALDDYTQVFRAPIYANIG